MRLSYDLHIHSCLSPCGDNDMTPANVVNMAALLKLDIIAVSDHNSALNLPAVFRAAKELESLLVIPAIEVCTSEEVHMLCLFSLLDGALEFSDYLHSLLPPIKNKADIFGEQLIVNEGDHVIGSEELLLINAANIGIEKLISLQQKFAFLAVPAHVDKNANSIISNLGYIPPEYNFSCVEVKNPENKVDFSGLKITNSDAHYLEHIHEPEFFLETEEKSTISVLNTLKKGVIFE